MSRRVKMETIFSHKLRRNYTQTTAYCKNQTWVTDSQTLKAQTTVQPIYRGYYTAAQRYDFYLRVVKTIFYERAQRVSKILFLTREDKSHIFKPPCNVLFII